MSHMYFFRNSQYIYIVDTSQGWLHLLESTRFPPFHKVWCAVDDIYHSIDIATVEEYRFMKPTHPSLCTFDCLSLQFEVLVRSDWNHCMARVGPTDSCNQPSHCLVILIRTCHF